MAGSSPAMTVGQRRHPLPHLQDQGGSAKPASCTISIAWHGHCSKHTAHPVHFIGSTLYPLPGPNFAIACSGHAAKQLSHSKHTPHDRQRCASCRAAASDSPAITSSNPLSRLLSSSRRCCDTSTSLNTGRCSMSKFTTAGLGGAS